MDWTAKWKATNGGIPCIAYTFRGMCEHSMFIIFVILHVHFYVFYMCWIVFAFAFDVVHWALTYSCCLHMTLHSTKHMECIRMEFAQPYSGTYVRFKFKYYFLSAICVQFRQKLYLPFNFTISTLPANERYREMRNNFSTQTFSLHMKRDALICTNNFLRWSEVYGARGMRWNFRKHSVILDHNDPVSAIKC